MTRTVRGAQQREERVHGVGGADHVDRKEPLPVIGGDALQRTKLHDPDVGGEDVARAEARRHFGGRGVEGLPVGHIDRPPEGRGAAGLQRGRDRFGRFAVDVQGRDGHAFGGERAGHGRPQTRTGAGDDRSAAPEPAHRARKSAGPPSTASPSTPRSMPRPSATWRTTSMSLRM